MRSLSCPAAARRPGARRGPCGTRAHGADAAAPPSGAEKISQSARDFRRALGQSENYSRKHLRDEEAAAAMAAAGVGAVSAGGLVAAMKQAGNTHVRGDLTLRLAQSYGFCWGVERAVQMAYEARRQYPTEKMWITNEIIHNPSVNQARRAGAPGRGSAAAASATSLTHLPLLAIFPTPPHNSGWPRWASSSSRRRWAARTSAGSRAARL